MLEIGDVVGTGEENLHHIKEQTLTEKRPLNLKGRFCIYSRKCRYFRHIRGFFYFRTFIQTSIKLCFRAHYLKAGIKNYEIEHLCT